MRTSLTSKNYLCVVFFNFGCDQVKQEIRVRNNSVFEYPLRFIIVFATNSEIMEIIGIH